LLFFVGLVVLTAAAEALNRGAVNLSLSLGVRPIIVGLTVVAFGTSCPELVVSVVAAVKPDGGSLALGNIIGSNIANLALILGVSAIIRPVRVEKSTLRREMPIALGGVVLFSILAWLGSGLSRIDGVILLAGFIAFIIYCIKSARKSDDKALGDLDEAASRKRESRRVDVILVIVGVIALAFGAHLMVSSAVFIAGRMGVPTFVIGVTVVALGTSLPELAASVVASIKGHSDLCVGNVAGSNIFNSLLILGVVALIRPIAVDASLFRFQIPAMLVFSMVIFPLMYTGMKLSRREGIGLLLAYIAFIWISFA